MSAGEIHIARLNGGVRWLEGIGPRGVKLAASWEKAADADALFGLFERCRAAQDEDPAFRAAAPALLAEAKEMRAGAR